MMNQSDQTFDENDSLITKDSSYRRKSQLYQQDINLLGRSFVSSGSYFQSLNNRKTSINNSTENPFNFNDNKNIHQPHTLHKETAFITEDYEDSNVLNDTETFNNDTIDSQVDFSNRKNPLFSPVSSNLESMYGSVTPCSSASMEEKDITGPPNYHDIKKFKSLSYCARQTTKYFPAAFLGVLLNLLDALSYGMIVFPITEPIFKDLGPAGLSLFYISSIISQLCYSGGLSLFGTSIGSEMIEITPFFHTMAFNNLQFYKNLGADVESYQMNIITTTLICFVLSSILTGLVFYLLGSLKLGKIVGFFPRHILIGCIGSVGYFLIITGIEVSLKIPKFSYNYKFWADLLPLDYNWGKLLLPILLTTTLIISQKKFNNNSLVLPAFYVGCLILFHFVVALMPNLNLPLLRQHGWIFSTANDEVATSSSSIIGDKWYSFYALFNFKYINWGLVVKNIPTMSALVFFGILHVPINVPALAVTLGCDKYSVDQELIAHGWSNFISGLFGAIPNYLVYTNSVLFIRAGADSRYAGVLLAILTAVVMFIGPSIIGFIPICVVGSLIFLLGYELLKESLMDTFNILSPFEYLTVLFIIITSAVFDFVMGIIVGLIIACFHFLVNSANLPSIQDEYDGTQLQSTVNRNAYQTELLNKVGDQIYILKLQNLLFFGTILSIEEKINIMLDREEKSRIIKYLILDFKNIKTDQIDYSAAEGFNRIKRFVSSKNITLIISSIKETDTIYKVFNKVGLLEDVELFNDLNSALEWCENKYLYHYKLLKNQQLAKLNVDKKEMSMPNIKVNNKDIKGSLNIASSPMFANTPRNDMFYKAAKNVINTETEVGKNLYQAINKNKSGTSDLLQKNDHQSTNYCLSLFLQSFKTFIEEKDFDKWSPISAYFKKVTVNPHEIISNDNCVILVESGLIKISYSVTENTTKTESVYETLAKKSAYGKITNNYYKIAPEFNDTVYAETESDIWILDHEKLNLLKKQNADLYIDVLTLISALNQYRYKKLLRFTIASG